MGWESAVSIATRYGLDGPGIEFWLGAGGSLCRGWNGQGAALTTHPHLAPRLKKE